MTESPRLKENSLGLSESVVMGIAGTAPAYSIAATTAVLVASIGALSMASLFYTGLIIFGVALAFFHLNRVHTNAGASFIWIGEIFHPIAGFFAGWSLLVAAAVFMVSGTIPAAVATLALYDPQYVNHPPVVSFVAALWLLLVSVIVIKGIKLSSYFQVFLTFVEILLLVIIIFGAIWAFHSQPLEAFTLHQFSLFQFDIETFAVGALSSLFFFWGWDVTVNLSEETKNASDNPGKGAIIAMFIVLGLFISFMVAAQFALSDNEMVSADTNIILVLAEKVFPKPYSYIAVIAVMLSTIGTLETTILQFTRTLFANGRNGTLNARYAQLHKTWHTPWYSTLVITSIGLILLFFASFFESVNQIIQVSVKAIGFQIAFYYGLTCLACAWYFRQTSIKDIKNYILLVLWPFLSGLFMAFIFFYCACTFDLLTSSVGLIGIAIGAIPLFLNKKSLRLSR